jgi:hypothetical protein
VPADCARARASSWAECFCCAFGLEPRGAGTGRLGLGLIGLALGGALQLHAVGELQSVRRAQLAQPFGVGGGLASDRSGAVDHLLAMGDADVVRADRRVVDRHERRLASQQPTLDGDQHRHAAHRVKEHVIELAELLAVRIDDALATPILDAFDADHVRSLTPVTSVGNPPQLGAYDVGRVI